MKRPDLGHFPIVQYFGDNPNLVVNGVQVYGPEGHDGVDIATPMSTPLYAPRDGTVVSVNRNSDFGLRVKIDNGTNLDYLGHLDSTLVTAGQHVTEGDLVAHSGKSGNVTGPHCHWGVYRYGGAALDPLAELANVNKENEDMDEQSLNILADTLRGTPGAGADPGFKASFLGKPLKDVLLAFQKSDEFKAMQAKLKAPAPVTGDAEKKLDQIKQIIGE
jgi:hypothetical protein